MTFNYIPLANNRNKMDFKIGLRKVGREVKTAPQEH